jgi:hypothetical protein
MMNSNLEPAHLKCFAQLLRGDPLSDEVLATLPDEWQHVAYTTRSANGQGRTQAFQEALVGRPDAEAVMYAVFATDPDEHAEPSIASDLPDCPPLPDGIQLDPTLGAVAGKWVDEYVAHAMAVSPMTPAFFHVSAALWLGALVIARRLRLRMLHADIFPNLFVAWIAPTTVWAKSASLEFARAIARCGLKHLLLPQEQTPEALLSDLAGREPANHDSMSAEDLAEWQLERNFAAQRGLILDEMSGLLTGVGRDYNAGLIESFLRFYDCDPSYTRSTRSQGRVSVRNSYVSILGASTPAAMSTYLANKRLWSMGFWPRFAILSPVTDRPTWQLPRAATELSKVINPLMRLYNRLPASTWSNPSQPIDVLLDEGARNAWLAYDKAARHDLLTPDLDQQLWGSYGRLPTQVLKIAMILAAFDWNDDDTPTIGLEHLARSITIVEDWRESVHRVVAAATETGYSSLSKRILARLSRAPSKGLTLRDLCKSLKDKTPAEIQATVEQMIEFGELVNETQPPGSKGGRPAKLRVRIP